MVRGDLVLLLHVLNILGVVSHVVQCHVSAYLAATERVSRGDEQVMDRSFGGLRSDGKDGCRSFLIPGINVIVDMLVQRGNHT